MDKKTKTIQGYGRRHEVPPFPGFWLSQDGNWKRKCPLCDCPYGDSMRASGESNGGWRWGCIACKATGSVWPKGTEEASK